MGTDDFHEVEKEDEDSYDQCALPDKESLLLLGLSTDHQKFESPKVELSSSSPQVIPSQESSRFAPRTSDSIPTVDGKLRLDDKLSVLIK